VLGRLGRSIGHYTAFQFHSTFAVVLKMAALATFG